MKAKVDRSIHYNKTHENDIQLKTLITPMFIEVYTWPVYCSSV